MKRYPVAENFLKQVLMALQGQVDECEIRSIKASARRYWYECQRDGHSSKEYYLRKR